MPSLEAELVEREARPDWEEDAQTVARNYATQVGATRSSPSDCLVLQARVVIYSILQNQPFVRATRIHPLLDFARDPVVGEERPVAACSSVAR